MRSTHVFLLAAQNIFCTTMLLKTTRVSKYGLLKDYVMSRFKLHF